MSDLLLDFVKQKPLSPDTGNHCPACGSVDVRTHGTMSTLAGMNNHHWTESDCAACGLKYTFEVKDGTPRNAWFTKGARGERVLLGMPSCFERYAYDCAACGGTVEREYLGMDGAPTRFLCATLKDGRCTREYRTFFRCRDCEKSIETDCDYWRPS